jgi:hypothetical protein
VLYYLYNNARVILVRKEGGERMKQNIMRNLKVQAAAGAAALLAPLHFAFAQVSVPYVPGFARWTVGQGGITGLIAFVISVALWLVGSIAILFLIYGGFLYITAGGNTKQADKGRDTIKNSVLGLVVVILAYVIVTTLINVLTVGAPGAGTATPTP